MDKKKILFICGSLNQTTILHKISKYLGAYDCYFTAYYGDTWIKWMSENGKIEYTITGYKSRFWCEEYLTDNGLQNDYRGEKNKYDLVMSCSDMIVPNNVKNIKSILIQEGTLTPENWRYHTVRALNWSRTLADTSMFGLSFSYDKFCVFSEGYKKIFVRKGCDPDKIVVTGVPNFDNVWEDYGNNNFPHKNYVLACTSYIRESKLPEDRIGFIKKTVALSEGKQVIFKIHPKEDLERAVREVKEYAPNALVYTSGNTEEMIANCDVLVTRYSTVILTALAMGKKVYSDMDSRIYDELKPIQTGGKSAVIIANIAKQLIEEN